MPRLEQEPASAVSGFSWFDPELLQSLEFSTGKKKTNLGSVLEEVDRISLSMLRASILLFHSLPKFVGFTVFLLFSISAPCLLTPSKSTGLIPKVGVFRKSKAY